MRILGSGSMYFRAYGCSRGSTVFWWKCARQAGTLDCVQGLGI